MRTSQALELSDARAVIEAAKREAAGNGWNVGVSVVDAGGCQIAFDRMDGAPPSSALVAQEKARTAALFRVATSGMEDRIEGRPAMLALPGATPLSGGVPLVAGGQVVGAVGVSGVMPQQDHQIAAAGAALIG